MNIPYLTSKAVIQKKKQFLLNLSSRWLPFIWAPLNYSPAKFSWNRLFAPAAVDSLSSFCNRNVLVLWVTIHLPPAKWGARGRCLCLGCSFPRWIPIVSAAQSVAGWASSCSSPWLCAAPEYDREMWEYLVVVLPDFAGGSVLSITHRTSVSQPDLLSSASVIFSFLGCPLWFFPRVYFCMATTTANFSPVSCLFWTCILQVSYGALSKNTDIFTFPDCGQISSSKIP